MVKEDLSSAKKRVMALLMEGELTSKKDLVFKFDGTCLGMPHSKQKSSST